MTVRQHWWGAQLVGGLTVAAHGVGFRVTVNTVIKRLWYWRCWRAERVGQQSFWV